MANGIDTVHLSYVRARTGHAPIGARQWIPQEHIADLVKSLVMGWSTSEGSLGPPSHGAGLSVSVPVAGWPGAGPRLPSRRVAAAPR